MKNASFAVKASLIASILLSGQSFAQNLPDEINHPHYLKIYQNLEQVLAQKSAEYEKLSQEKAELVKIITQMEKDQVEIPARNIELQKLIESKRSEINRIDSEIQGLEGVLGKIIEDLRRLDNMIAQLQRDLNEESARAHDIQTRRNQIAQDVALINARLEREIREENQSVQVLNRLTGELEGTRNRKHEVEVERNQLIRNVERFKGEIKEARNNVNRNNSELNTKKPQLADARAKLPGVQAELKNEQGKLSQIDSQLNPKKTELNKLKAELARLSPDIARLQNENKGLEQKISANESKIASLNVDAQIQRRDSLENQIAGVKNKIKENNEAKVALQEKIKPTLGQINELTVKWREAIRRRDKPEADRLKQEIDALNNSIANDRREIQRLQKEADHLTISIAARQNEINNLNTAIKNAQNQIAALQAEIASANNKIAENNKKIAEQSAANAGLAKQIADLEAEIKVLENQRAPIASKVAQLNQQENQLESRIKNLTAEVQRLEAETNVLNTRIAEMEKTITEFPQTMRRHDAHIRQLEEKSRELNMQIDREQRLLARIRQDRMTVQAERDRAQNVLNQVNQDLMNSERLIGAIRNKLNEEQQNREALTRYNQESIRKLDYLKGAKDNAEKEIADASEEIRINDQDIATIAQELPKHRADLNVLNPKVAAAESARNTAETNVRNASNQYQGRLSLYQKYLTDSQTLGAGKAAVGTEDGNKDGSVEARTKAQKLGSENASLQGKWEALRRGYIRGEITGYATGFDIGLSSTPDAQRGSEEGRIAGERRAKDYADHVLKPQKYLEELDRRLKEDSTQPGKPMMAMLINNELSKIKSMARELETSIPELSQSEIEEAQRIVTSLDALIAQSEVEIEEILKLRRNLSQAQNVYSTPGSGPNANKVDCSEVYKGVKDFVEACKGAYVMKYQGLYNQAHSEAFRKEYPAAFKGQISRVFEADLSRLYPGYFNEALGVAKKAGEAAGKNEIYQQSFNRAENVAYGGSLPGETSRVETEAVNLVQEHLNQNAALTLKGSAKLSTASIYGIAPGAETELKMLIKNIGSEASTGNSLVRITELSGNLSPERREAPLTQVAARSHADLTVMNIKVNDAAVPGTKAVIAGEIIHPGNHYRSSRVESFRIETVLGVNPAIESSFVLDRTPKVSGLFGILKKHNIDLKIMPKHSGVDLGYEVSLEEVGTDYVQIVSAPSKTEVLDRGVQKQLRFTYKLSKSARGQMVKLKITVKNDGKIVSEEAIEIKPE
ncbi:MAG: hypothetical protein ACLGHN_11335 [Bacteriovoracia bacterium]